MPPFLDESDQSGAMNDGPYHMDFPHKGTLDYWLRLVIFIIIEQSSLGSKAKASFGLSTEVAGRHVKKSKKAAR